MNKQFDLHAMNDVTAPDVIVITETFWIAVAIMNGEVLVVS